MKKLIYIPILLLLLSCNKEICTITYNSFMYGDEPEILLEVDKKVEVYKYRFNTWVYTDTILSYNNKTLYLYPTLFNEIKINEKYCETIKEGF